MIPLNAAGRIGLNVLLLLAGVVALRLGESVFVPMLIALLLATVLGPAAHWMHTALKVRWWLASMTVVIGLVLASLFVTAVFSTSITRLVTRLSDEKQAKKLYGDFRERLAGVSPVQLDPELFPEKPASISEVGVLKYANDAAPYILRETAKYSANWLWQMVITLFITFFVLLEGRMLARRAVAIFGPAPEVQSKATEVLFEMAKQVRTYLVWRTLINLGLALVMWIIYSACGVQNAGTWAILLAILNYIPYVGPVLASIPPFLDAFIFSGPATAVVVTIAFWVVVILEGYLVVPLLMGHNMNLNATTVMMACLFWDLVWGMTGLFLAMPIMAGIKAILYHVPEWRPWANLMSSTGDEPPPARRTDDEPPPATHAPLIPPSPSDSPNGKPGVPHTEGVMAGEAETHHV